jgi:two-component system sensor histidine kinase PilS (NtrC family)
MRTAVLHDLDPARWVPLRYLNFFRLVIAGLFLVAGRDLNLGSDEPRLFTLVALIYLGAVLALGFPDAARRLGLDRLITLQFVIDIAVLVIIMWASGGYRSGMPVLIMVILAGAGLVAEGRMVLFFAALATVAVLTENVLRVYNDGAAADFLQVGVVCIGFFGIAIVSRLLALRAKSNAALAAQRGDALVRQQAVNEHIIRDMQDGVLVLGGDGVVRQANPRAAALLGVATLEGIALTLIDDRLDAGRLRAAGPKGIVHRAGAAGKLLRCRAVGADADGKDDGDTLIYLTDFEEIQKQIQQFKLAALGRLTASMAHEIRNPLAAVMQAAELLKDEKRGEVQLRLVRIVNDNSRRIERMIKDVLALGRRDETLPETLHLASFVAGIIEEFSLKGGAERAIFEIDIPAGLNLVVDREHLHQILDNLLTNARRYCSGTESSVRICTEGEDAGQRHSIRIDHRRFREPASLDILEGRCEMDIELSEVIIVVRSTA